MDAKKRIAFIITKAEVGGAQRWTRDQLNLLTEDADCYLVCGETGWLTDNWKGPTRIEAGVRSLIPRPGTLWRLRNYLRKHRIDTIVASSAAAGIQARLLKVLMPSLRVVYVSHGWSSIYNGGALSPLYTGVERWLSRYTDLILNVSKSDAKRCHQVIKPHCPTLTVQNRVPRPSQPPSSLPPGPPWQLLFLGRLAAPKRPDLLIKAISELTDPSVTLTVVGDGPMRTALESQAPPNVRFKGEIANFNDFEHFHLLCLISDSEGLPMSAIEARAAGRPLLLSNVGGCGELVEPGYNGLLCNNNSENICAKIREILQNHELYAAAALNLAAQSWLEQSRGQYLSAYFGSVPN